MEDLRTRAQLVAFDPARAGAGSIGTVVPRAEIAEAAARNEFPATFFLDLQRVERADGSDVTAHARVAVDWDEETLSQLLASTEEDEIALWFDEPKLALAFDDVEAHGFREKAAVLAIAITAAGASAAPSLASRAAPSTGGGSGVVATPQTGGGSGVVATPETGGGSGMLASPSTGGGSGVKATPEAGGGSGVKATPEAGGGSGVKATPEAGGGSGVKASPEAGGGSGVKATPEAGGGSGTQSPAVTSSGGTSEAELAALAGAGALLISAAGFGVARRRTRPDQPA